MGWEILFFVVGIYAVIGVQIGKFAQKKGRSFLTFFWLTVLLSPIITGIIVAVMQPLPGNTSNQLPPREVAELAKAADLLKEGLITHEEFKAIKAKVLGSGGTAAPNQ